MVLSLAFALRVARGTSFWVDEVAWYMQSPNFGLKTALEPHLGHLVLVPHLVYKLFFDLFGASYLPFRLLTLATVITTSALLFIWLRRRIGGRAALAPCVLLLFFGADYFHVLTGNGFTIVGAIACGVGAFLMLEREDRHGDAWACVLLCLGVATYSVALAFLAGACVWLMLTREWRRIWVVAIPAALYVAWWLWTKTLPPSPESSFSLQQILLLPAWGFQTLSAMLQTASGFSYQFSGGAAPPPVGPVLAIAVITAVSFRLLIGRVSRAAWAAIGIVIGLWALGAVTAGGIRHPENARYFMPLAAALVLLAGEALPRAQIRGRGLITLYVFFGAATAVNLFLLRDGGLALRAEDTPTVRASLTALEVAGPSAKSEIPLVHPDGSPAPEMETIGVPIRILEAEERSPARAYEEAAESYGGIGYSLSELGRQGNALKSTTDAILAEAEGLRLEPAPGAELRDCRSATATASNPAVLPIPTGGALLELRGASAPLTLGRFAEGEYVPLGTAEESTPLLFRVPRDRSRVPWRVSTPAGTIVVCRR